MPCAACGNGECVDVYLPPFTSGRSEVVTLSGCDRDILNAILEALGGTPVTTNYTYSTYTQQVTGDVTITPPAGCVIVSYTVTSFGENGERCIYNSYTIDTGSGAMYYPAEIQQVEAETTQGPVSTNLGFSQIVLDADIAGFQDAESQFLVQYVVRC